MPDLAPQQKEELASIIRRMQADGIDDEQISEVAQRYAERFRIPEPLAAPPVRMEKQSLYPGQSAVENIAGFPTGQFKTVARMPFRALGKPVPQALEPQNVGEQIGGVAGDVGMLATPGGAARALPWAGRIGKVGKVAAEAGGVAGLMGLQGASPAEAGTAGALTAAIPAAGAAVRAVGTPSRLLASILGRNVPKGVVEEVAKLGPAGSRDALLAKAEAARKAVEAQRASRIARFGGKQFLASLDKRVENLKEAEALLTKSAPSGSRPLGYGLIAGGFALSDLLAGNPVAAAKIAAVLGLRSVERSTPARTSTVKLLSKRPLKGGIPSVLRNLLFAGAANEGGGW
jgi:hypothetical protein